MCWVLWEASQRRLDGCEKALGLGDSEVLVEMSHADVVVTRREQLEYLEEHVNALWAEHQP
jgi:hypothetical protein